MCWEIQIGNDDVDDVEQSRMQELARRANGSMLNPACGKAVYREFKPAPNMTAHAAERIPEVASPFTGCCKETLKKGLMSGAVGTLQKEGYTEEKRAEIAYALDICRWMFENDQVSRD